MKLLRRLLGLDEAEPAAQVPSAREDFSDAQDDSRERVRVTLSGIGRTCVNVDELDLFGTSTPSPNGRLAIVVGSIINGEPSTGAPRDGAYAVLEDRLLLAHGTVERPHDAKVADNGAFVMNDWMHGGELAGRFLGFRRGGQPAFAHLFSANLACNGISSDGRYAACQTLSSPGSPDDTIAALFDLESGQLLARFKVESGTAEGFEFDSGLGHVHALLRDGDRETYDLDGRMVDGPAWVARRIARGDLTVIGGVVKTIGEAPDAALAEQLLSGLRYGATHGDAWTQARAERLRGELLEILALPAEALEAYDAALALDPQVGVARRSDKLRRKLERPAGNPAPRQSRFERQAARLGIRHELIRLDSDGPKRWRFGPDGPFRLVEEAALDHFAADGWSGAVAEGGLMLTVIKAASFANLAQRNADTFIEALYHQNVAFEEDRFDRDRLIETVRGADLDQLARNWKVISANAGTTPAFYPRVGWRHVMGLFETLGNERLAQVAEIFATAPYDFRAGWPDLTLWRNGAIRFVEVKSPSDQMHASQTWLISKVLVPLGFDTVLLEVAKSPTA